MELNSLGIFTGTKFYRYIDDQEEPEVIRVYTIPSNKSKSDTVTYLDKDKHKHRMSLDYLLKNYRLLASDGMLMVGIIKLEEGYPDDVIIALQNTKNASSGPYAICRQSIYDFFSNIGNEIANKCYIGLSLSRDTCPANVDFDQCMACNGLKYNRPVAVYLDDTLDDILGLFSNSRYDKTLAEFKRRTLNANSDKIFVGLETTLKDLLDHNRFMVDFRRCFNIKEVPFHIDESFEQLSIENILFLEDELKINIMETYLVKYTKEINLNEIRRDYLLVSSAKDNFDSVYIVGYDKSDGPYVPRSTV